MLSILDLDSLTTQELLNMTTPNRISTTDPSREELGKLVLRVGGIPISGDWVDSLFTTMNLWPSGEVKTAPYGREHLRLSVEWQWEDGFLEVVISR